MHRGDRYVVNGLAAHPLLPSMITCGIDNDVKVWSCGEAPYMVLPSSSSVECMYLRTMYGLSIPLTVSVASSFRSLSSTVEVSYAP